MSQMVLMIDDDEQLSSMLAEYLQPMDFLLTGVPTVAEGLSLLRTHAFDLMILDVMLPDGDGFDVCRSVRAESGIPILMLTARGEETDRIVGLELGADDYLPKPFNPRELLARLRAIARRRSGGAAPSSSVLRFGRLEIDPEQRTVAVAGQVCTLTGYQFDLLLALARNAGRVMSRDQLMNALRGHNLDAFDRSIDVHISRIRAAIEDDPKVPKRVVTLRGAGYLFARAQDY
jgi:two-component system, OmpR family, phosphate regulon response regulator OmpR